MKVATNYGASKAVKLNVAGAFHSEFMRPAYNALKEVLDKVEFSPPKIPVMFNVDAEIERLLFSLLQLWFCNLFFFVVMWSKSRASC
jgi:malonyl CoA-acyl carrier protein transacylase